MEAIDIRFEECTNVQLFRMLMNIEDDEILNDIHEERREESYKI